MLLSAGALVTGLATAQDRQTEQERAIAAIRKLGGEVTVSSKKAGAPVSVILTGSTSPADCLPHLKEVGNLHTCNL
jgi:hypothetical protein